MYFALIQWMGIMTTLPDVTHQRIQGFPSRVTSCAQLGYKPRHLFHTLSLFLSLSLLLCQLDLLYMYEYLPPESKIATHSTHSTHSTHYIFANFEGKRSF